MLAGVVRLAPGSFHTMLVKEDGSVWGSGVNSDGEGKGFMQVMESGALVAAVGNYFSIVLKDDCNLWATGTSSKGQLFFFQRTSRK